MDTTRKVPVIRKSLKPARPLHRLSAEMGKWHCLSLNCFYYQSAKFNAYGKSDLCGISAVYNHSVICCWTV